MDTLSPQSVLDHRTRETPGTNVHLIPDRVTRTVSPGRLKSKSALSVSEEEEVELQISQPYRTSFSAITRPVRTKRDRSRSTSPAYSTTSSMKSDRSRSKSPASRKLGPKHVTYDSKVTVRHSDSFDSESMTRANESIDSAFDPSYTEDHPNEDFTSKIREMTQLIVKEYSDQNESDERENVENAKPEIKEKRQMGRRGNAAARNGVANGGVPLSRKPVNPVHVLSREYDHDRTVSYRKAITNQYSDEIKKLAQAKIEENYSPEVTVSAPERERSNSMPSQPETEQPNRLTPSKRTVGGSIGNFFRKLSPRLGRKSRKDKTGSVSSLDSEAQKEKRDDSFSRSRVRQSLMKLMGRGKSRSASRSRSEQGSVDDVSLEQEAGFVAPDRDSRNPQNFSTSSNRILKSIEQNSRSEKDVYHRFKEKQSPKTLGEKNVTNSGDIPQNRTQAVRVTPTRTEPSTKEAGTNEKRLSNNSDKENRTIVNGRVDPTVPDIVRDATRLEKRVWAEGETNIDMVDSGPPRIDSPGGGDVRLAGKSHRGLMSGSLGGEGSIGECSLDVNLTGSEPSLSGGVDTASSKRVVLGSRENTIDSSSALSPIAASTPSVCLTEQKSSYRDQENDRFYTHSMPKLADTAEFSIPESTKIPSYLKLSCAVSGYGRYSQYSSYKSIEKRSPYSSCSSLHNSDPRSPEIMPVSRIVSPVSKTRGSNSELGLISPQPLDYRNGHVTNGVLHSDSVTNGQSRLRETYPTGDKKLDGEYFLNLTQEWENRLMSHCQNVEPDIHCPNLPEDAHGKIRAAIGKANLLMSQKFKQFQQLCSEHMFPSEDGKVLKWEDLQGFWDMIKIQADNVDDMFAEIELMRQNGWKELNTHSHSRASSVSSSPKSGSLSLSNASTPAGTPGTRRKSSAKPKDTPESSPERTEKMRQAAKSREEARKKMLAEKRAAMKQKQKQQKQSDDVEIFVTDSTN